MEINKPTSIAPLALLRITFGAVMLISTLRFILKGWVRDFYITPKFFFPFIDWLDPSPNWLRPLPAAGIYLIFAVMTVTSLLITVGLFYRPSIIAFFLSFTYIELLDKSDYLNHYYLVTLISFLLIWVPADRYWSLNVKRRPARRRTHAPAWTIDIFKLQILIVYFCAGIGKLNPDWLLHAMPLKLWLPANASLPLIGPLLKQPWTAYIFSWFGALFDLTIGFFLLYRPTRKPAYIFVILFHLITALLFKIGMFPYIMLATTVIFFGPELPRPTTTTIYQPVLNIRPLLALYFIIQLLLPFRYLLYPGHLFWTEQGYRFSWRVMLMEKAGTTFFYVKNPITNRSGEVLNRQFLTPLQERMMQTQPDMILQYAHYLHDYYQQKGIPDPIVTVESYVTLNGSGSRLYIDSTVNLAKQKENLLPKKWILPCQP